MLCGALLAPSAAGAVPFSPSSFWNRPLATQETLAANSATLATELNRQVAAYGTWINTDHYSVPVYTVSATQPLVKVKLDVNAPALQAYFAAVPLPANARPAAGYDGHLVVEQPATDTQWEFWVLYKAADGWHARWGAKIAGASRSPGYIAAPYGATATGLPLLGGLLRPAELTARRIDHAIALGVPNVTAGVFSWPAQRTDGTVTGPLSLPAGTRFRLPATLNLDTLGMAPATKAIAVAVQRYGMVVRDTAGCVCLYAEDTTQYGTWPYGTIFGTNWMDGRNALRGFPWNKLQVLAPR